MPTFNAGDTLNISLGTDDRLTFDGAGSYACTLANGTVTTGTLTGRQYLGGFQQMANLVIFATSAGTYTIAFQRNLVDHAEEHVGLGLAGAEINISSQLPRLFEAIRTQNDASPTPIRLFGLGSSVGVGATLPDPSTQAPVQVFAQLLASAINPLGNLTISTTNGSVNGSTISGGVATDYAAAKSAAGGNPTLALLCYGMNDGMQGQYHSGQTYPGAYSALVNLVNMIRGDGGDVIIVTTPHPHTDVTPWESYTTPVSYPANNNQIPAPTKASSVVTADYLGNGQPVPASYRHKRINDLMRKVAFDMGCALIDAERYWFEAVAAQGQAALFNTGEYAHPNLLGHQLSYQTAFAQFVRLLKSGRGTVVAPPVLDNVAVYKVNNAAYTTTTFASDLQLSFYAGVNQVWEVEADIFYTAPTAGDLKIQFSGPSGVGGRFGLQAPANDATSFDSGPMISRSTTIAGGWMSCGGNGADAIARVKAVVTTGSTPGNVVMQFAQLAASGTTTVYQYSMLRARRIA